MCVSNQTWLTHCAFLQQKETASGEREAQVAAAANQRRPVRHLRPAHLLLSVPQAAQRHRPQRRPSRAGVRVRAGTCAQVDPAGSQLVGTFVHWRVLRALCLLNRT